MTSNILIASLATNKNKERAYCVCYLTTSGGEVPVLDLRRE